MAPHKDHPTKIINLRMDLLEILILRTLAMAREVKRCTSIAVLDVRLRSSIKIAMSHRVYPTDIMRIGLIKKNPTMAAIGGTEAGAKTQVEGGRPRNGHWGDQ